MSSCLETDGGVGAGFSSWMLAAAATLCFICTSSSHVRTWLWISVSRPGRGPKADTTRGCRHHITMKWHIVLRLNLKLILEVEPLHKKKSMQLHRFALGSVNWSEETFMQVKIMLLDNLYKLYMHHWNVHWQAEPEALIWLSINHQRGKNVAGLFEFSL